MLFVLTYYSDDNTYFVYWIRWHTYIY